MGMNLIKFRTIYRMLFLKITSGICIIGGLLSYFRSLIGSREMRILILGLDGAGKTTILYR